MPAGLSDRPDRLRPRARLMLTIGLELISSETVAITELVKNSFDADATHVLVQVTGPVTDGTIPAGQGTITVLDDGTGMSADIIAGTWLEPATPSRRRKTTTESGRRALGEKGVGRFAAAKLAHTIELVSREADSDEVVLGLNWDAFEDEDAYLDSIHVDWTEREPLAFRADGDIADIWRRTLRQHLGADAALPDATHGTLLQMEDSRTGWDRATISEFRTTLSRLVSPFGAEQGLVRDFTLILDAPTEFGTLSGLVEAPEQLSRPHYTLEAEVDALGAAAGEMELKDGQRVVINQQLQNADDELPDAEHPLRSGPFSISLRVWDRDSLADVAGAESVKSVRDILDRAAGISIYRDGFRVLPYGEPRDDWLRLDLRRVQSPTRRLSNNQIVGYLVIGRDSNSDLVDQTNREGIVEGPAFEDLRSAVRQLLILLENARYEIRPRRERGRTHGLLDRIDLRELREAIAAALPGNQMITEMVVELQRDLDQRNEEVGEVLARYHRLATLGQLIDRVVHELGQPLVVTRQAADLALERIDRARPKLLDDCASLVEQLAITLQQVRAQNGVAADVLRRIEPFGGRRRGRPRPIGLESSIADAVALMQEDVTKTGTSVSLPEGSTQVTVDGTELQEVIVNLLSNSLYWLRKVPKAHRQIEISIQRNLDRSLSVIIEDSGPGVPEEDRARIFDPYFTTRDGGVGLGLSIAGEIVEDYYGGRLSLLPPGDLGGARFEARLVKRVN